MDRQTSFQSGFNRRFNQLMTMEKAAGKLNKGNAANVFGGTQMKKKPKALPTAATPIKSAPAVAAPPVADPAPAPMKVTPPIVASDATVTAPPAELLSKPAPSPVAAPQFNVPITAPKTNVLPSPATSPLPVASPSAPPMDAVGSFRERLREMIAKGSAGAAPALSLPLQETPLNAKLPGMSNLQAATPVALPPNEELASKAKSLVKGAAIKSAGRGDFFIKALGKAGLGMRDYSTIAAKRFGGHRLVSDYHPTELASSMGRAISGKLPTLVQGAREDTGVRQLLRGNAALDLNNFRKAQWGARRAEQSAAGANVAQQNAYGSAKGMREAVGGPSVGEQNFTLPGRAVALRPKPPVIDVDPTGGSWWQNVRNSFAAHPRVQQAGEFYNKHRTPINIGGIGAGMYGSNLYGQHTAAEEARQRAAQASFMQRLMYLVNPSSVYNM